MLHNRRTLLSFFFVFLTSRKISLRPAVFLLLILRQVFFFVNCPSLLSSLPLIIFRISLSVIIGEFVSRFLKCIFHFSIFLLGFEFCSQYAFLSVYDANRDSPTSTGFLILYIWP